jgi:predicted HTH transcriptional regulator
MIPKPTNDIRLADLESLVGRVPEGKTIEYKRELPAGTREERIKFLAAISSLANTAGGDLLIGVEAKDGIPTGIPGVAVASGVSGNGHISRTIGSQFSCCSSVIVHLDRT